MEHAENNLFYKHGLKRLLNPQRILVFFLTRSFMDIILKTMETFK